MEALVFCDDCGHMRAMDMSTPEQKYKIFEGICKQAAKEGAFNAKEKQKVKDLLANKDYEALETFLSDKDVIQLNQRGCASIVPLEQEWDTNTGILNI